MNILFLTVALHYLTLIFGWQIASFVYIYSSMDEARIALHLSQYYYFQPYILGLGVPIIAWFLILERKPPTSGSDKYRKFILDCGRLYTFLLFLILNNILFVVNYHFNVLELLSFLLSIWLLKKLGLLLYNAPAEGWAHPTTVGNAYITTLLIGCSLLDIFGMINLRTPEMIIIFLLLLLFDLIIQYARFQFLVRYSPATNRLAKELMGRQILFFGSRLVIADFMPLVFIIYSAWLSTQPIEGVTVLIMLGTFLDRYLFVQTGFGKRSIPSSDNGFNR